MLNISLCMNREYVMASFNLFKNLCSESFPLTYARKIVTILDQNNILENCKK